MQTAPATESTGGDRPSSRAATYPAAHPAASRILASGHGTLLRQTLRLPGLPQHLHQRLHQRLRQHLRRLAWVSIVAGLCASSAFASSADDLIVAARRDSDISTRSLLRAGVDGNASDSQGRTALTLAIREESGKVVRTLLAWPGIDINRANRAGETPLMMAIISGQEGLAQELLQRGATVNKTGWTPLHYAATRGHTGMVRELLARHAYIDAQSPNGTTPLMMAAQYGSDAATRLLLDEGADPWARNQLGLTALDFARKSAVQPRIDMLQAAQQRTPDHGGRAQAAQPLAVVHTPPDAVTAARSAQQARDLHVPDPADVPDTPVSPDVPDAPKVPKASADTPVQPATTPDPVAVQATAAPSPAASAAAGGTAQQVGQRQQP